MNGYAAVIAQSLRADPLFEAAVQAANRAWRWLKWKWLCWRWRRNPGFHDPAKITWPLRLAAEPSL